MKKTIKGLAFAMALGIMSTPTWATDTYLQDFTGPNGETSTPAPFGNAFGGGLISTGIQDNAAYLMFNDTSVSPINAFLGGYFQRFGDVATATKDFTGSAISVDVTQIPVNNVVNPTPGAGFFAFTVAFDSNGDGVYTDGTDTVYRTNLSTNPFTLPGTTTSTLSVGLDQSNFQFDPAFAGQTPFWDVTKVDRIGFEVLQNIPENGNLNFPNNTDLGWKFDNLKVDVVPIPEAGTFAMMALGLVGVAGFLRRRK